MSVQIACLGWHWLPYRYSRRVDDDDGRPVPPVPDWLARLGARAVHDAVSVDPGIATAPVDPTAEGTDGYVPDVALINWYGPGARMGMHVDRDEKVPAPVVSLSLGDSSRLAYHGVPRVFPGTGPPGLGVVDGRFNITIRESGLVDPS
jgi:alkylated DNA repair protein (DNA oxidative demethylase)